MPDITQIPNYIRAGVPTGTRPSVPEGAGDTHWNPSSQVLSIANAAADAWIEYTLSDIGAAIAMDDLSDVDAASPNTNDVLAWNGSEYVPVAPGGGGGYVGCQVKVAGQEINENATGEEVSFSSEFFDTDSIWSSTPNPTRLTVPAGMGGYWKLTFSFYATMNAIPQQGGDARLSFKRNGSTSSSLPDTYEFPMSEDKSESGTDNHKSAAALTGVINLSAGDYLEIHVVNNHWSGGVGSSFFLYGTAIMEYLGT